MEKYIKESLAAGIICPSSSLVGAGFFFVGKKDSSTLILLSSRCCVRNSVMSRVHLLLLALIVFHRVFPSSLYIALLMFIVALVFPRTCIYLTALVFCHIYVYSPRFASLPLWQGVLRGTAVGALTTELMI